MIRAKLYVIFLTVCLCAAASPAQTGTDRTALDAIRKTVESGKLAEAERELLKYVIGHPADAEGYSLLAGLRLRQQRFDEAAALSRKALSLDPRLVSARVTAATADLKRGNVALAREALAAIPEEDLAAEKDRRAVAEAMAEAGDCPNALRLIGKLPVRTRNGELLPVRAGCYLATGDRKSLAALVPLGAPAAVGNPATGVRFAEVLSRAGMLPEALSLLRTVAASNPRNAEVLLALARVEIGLKDYKSARTHLAVARKAAPESAEADSTEAVLESAAGNDERAYELLTAALGRDPENLDYLSRYVIAAMRANESANAVRAAERLIARQPGNPDFLYLHGAASLRANSIAAAETSLVRYVALRPEDSRGCLALGLTYAAQPDKLEQARQTMESCLVRDPRNFEAAYQLGLFYKTQGDAAKAVEYLEKTVAIVPDYQAALRDLGASLIQTGAEARARQYLEKAVKLDPNDAETHFQLSRLYNILGERELGKKHFELFQQLRNPKKTGM